jgi:hypothetical protein
MENKPGPKPNISTFGFIDEVGILHSPQEDRVFGLGLLKIQHPSDIHKLIIQYKNKTKYYDEFKFRDVNPRNLPLYKGFIDLFFNTKNVTFCSLIFDKASLDIHKYFHDNYFKAYNAFAAKLIAESLETGEYITVLADDINTPKDDNFEKEIRSKVKMKTRRDALFGVCRLESHAVSEIQMVDVLLGVVAYSFKIKYGIVKPNKKNAKFQLVKHIQKHLNVDQLSTSHKHSLRFGRRFSVKEFQGGTIKKIGSDLNSIAN